MNKKQEKNYEQEKQWLLKEKYNVNEEKKLNNKEYQSYLIDLKKLENGEPIAYIIGNIPFFNTLIDLKYKPLIPRSETEFWVYDFFNNDLNIKLNNTKKNIDILDIFSGSGCIGISILKNYFDKKNIKVLPKIFVDFGEINKNFIKQIKKNIKINLESIIDTNKITHVYKTDIFNNLPLKKWDFILANPPYIPKNKIKKTDKSVLDFEDFNSLFADDNGLFFIKKIISEGLNLLKKDGKIFIEFDETSKNDIETYLIKNDFTNYIFKKDQFNNWRILIIWK